jgi:MFS family permease
VKGHANDYPALWSGQYTLTILGTLFIFIPYALFLPVLPVYILERLHGSLEAAGSVNAVFLIASVLFRAQTMWLEALFGRRRTLLASCFLFFVSNCLYLVATHTVTLIATRFFSGICFAIANTSIMSLGSRLAPRQRIGEGLAYLTTVVTAGTAIGPFAGLSLARAYGFAAVFVFSALMTFIGLVITFAIRIPDDIANEPRIVCRFNFRENYEFKAVPVSTALLLMAVAYSGVISFVSVYAKQLHLLFAGSWFFVVLSVFSIVSRLATGRLYDRFGANAVMYPAIFLLSAGLLLLGMASSSAALLTAAALVGLAYGIAVPSVQTIAIQKSPSHRISAVTATVFTFLDMGMGAGAYIVGVGIHALGYAGLYLLLSPLVLSVSFLYYCVHGRKAIAVGTQG